MPTTLKRALSGGKLTNDSGLPTFTPVIVGAGQSNIANWSRSDGTWHATGEASLNATISAIISGASFINAGDGASYLTKTIFDTANTRLGGTLEAGDYWVDDTTTPFTPGPRLNTMLSLITAAGKTHAQVTHILWSQGESDSSEINLTPALLSNYTAALQWLICTYFPATFSGLRSTHIRPIGRRSNSGSFKYHAIRALQRSLHNGSTIRYGSETYDLPMQQESFVDDGVHRSDAGYTTEASRAAREILKGMGRTSGNTRGARILHARYDDSTATITLTIDHDEGSRLATRSGTAFSGTPLDITPTSGTAFFRLFDALGTELPITQVQITGVQTLTLTLGTPLLAAGNTLYAGYETMQGIDLNTLVFDDASPALPLQCGSFTVDGRLDNIRQMSGLISYFSPSARRNIASTASDGVVWDKSAGSGSAARKDDTKAAPAWAADAGMGLAISGWYFNGSTSQKLLVEHSLTTGSNVTMFIVATPDHDVSDPTTATSTNALITTSGVASTDNALFAIFQNRTALGQTSILCAGQSAASATHNSTTAILGMRRSGSTVDFWDETRKITTATITNTPTVESDNGTPVFAIGNVVDKTAGSDPNQAFIGAVHYVVVFGSALTDAQVNQLRLALGAAAGVSVV